MKNLIVTALAFLALAATSTAQSIPSYVPTAGLVGWWPFNGNANDESGNGHNGQAYFVTNTNNRFNQPNSALMFNGIELGNGSTVEITDKILNIGENQYSISIWFSPNNLSQITRCFINTIPHTGIGIGYNDNNAPGYCVYAIGPANAFWSTLYNHGAFNGYQVNDWYNVVLVKNGTNYFQYINGVLDHSTNVAAALTYNYQVSFRISGISTQYQIFDGKLDDIGIWNRALTQAEITALYNAPGCTANITASGPTTFCQGGSVLLSANTGAGLSYQWRSNGINISGATDAHYSANSAGLYSVIVTDGNGCSATSTEIKVTVNPTPTATINAGGSTTFCQGGSVLLNANSGTNLTYQWINNNNNIAGATAASYIANAAGSYTVAVTDENGCSTISTATTVTVNPPPTAIVNTSGSTTICQGSSVLLNANSGTNLTYHWKINGNIISGATASNYTASVAGLYTVVVTDGNGCSNVSSATTVTVIPAPPVSISGLGNSTNINADPVTLLGKPAGGSFSGPGVNGSVFNPRAAGLGSATIVYTFTNANGCSNTASQTTIVSDSPPQLMSYQAVVRNSSNQLLSTAPVGMRVSILQGSTNGAAVYIEKHSSSTNAQGLVTLAIGGGTAQSGSFAGINWANGPYFLKVETDPTGGNNYSITATSQLLSVPYALHSATSVKAENGVPTGATQGQVFTFCDGVPIWTDGGLCPGKLSGFNCGASTNTGTLYKGIAATSASSTISYNGGNGGIYSAQSIPSTGVTGLTATIAAGTLASGAGSLTYTFSGTPSGSGTASFALSLGGQTCTLTRNVDTLTAGPYPVGTVHCNGTPTAVVPVVNPATGKIWMDRNLGASQAATSSTDAAAYGDLYQWGRRADGHQCRNSATTSTLSSTDQPAHGDFISGTGDWRSPKNDNLWQTASGMNNPCPIGYRVPTETELNTERLTWSSNDSSGALASALKLPLTGYRYDLDGSLQEVGNGGVYWSSSTSADIAIQLEISKGGAGSSTNRRMYGFAVRCIKD